jgi:hypothetical protein
MISLLSQYNTKKDPYITFDVCHWEEIRCRTFTRRVHFLWILLVRRSWRESKDDE